ncbi:MAG: APC family permease [Chloroflexi bacterium]|nr:MAG: APC family permease [Chloroflexota bacterium]
MTERNHRGSFVRIPRGRRKSAKSSLPSRSDDKPVDGHVPVWAPPDSVTSHEVGHPSERIVIPRHDRAGPAASGLGIELREVRFGSTARTPYLRVVPSQLSFKSVAPGYIAATEVSSRPRGRIERTVQAIKRVALGSPFATSQLIHERLTKMKALAIFSSDVLSSSAYATEEILLVLLLAGSGALHNGLPIAAAIVLLLAIVTLSYRQTIKAYPSGGGAYIVAHDNLGRTPGLIAAGALLVDYVLTVSVSVAAGVAAVTSAVPEVHDLRVPMGVAVVALITLGNLRGVRESGTIFAAPTYFFLLMMGALILTGLAKVMLGETPGSLLHEAPPQEQVVATQGLSLWLIFRAFSSGCSALTGTEAISNGVPAFKPPESQNARTTLTMMAFILGFIFIGVTFLTSRYGLVPNEKETIVSLLGRDVFGDNVLYYAYQAATALVLFLAANTSFADFPRLSAILARDKFMPRQFAFKGDRLAFSNGIMLLAGAAALLLIVFGGNVTNLIPLYAVGVFVSFTLSQSVMVRHWWRLRETGWRGSLVINGTGAIATAAVAVIITTTKLSGGAWISIIAMGSLVLMFALIRRHYDWFQRRTAVDENSLPVRVPPAPSSEAPRDHVIVPVDGLNEIALGAISMAREISPLVTTVHLTDDREQAEELRKRWERAVPDVPLLIIESPYRAFVAPMLAYLERLDEQEHMRITVILPTFVPRHWWERILHNRDVLRLRPFLKGRPGLRVVDFPYQLYEEKHAQRHASGGAAAA